MAEQDERIRYFDEEPEIPHTIWWDEGKKVVKLIDQKALPHEIRVIECIDWKCIGEAIEDLRIRGAPALGAAGAYALAIEAQRFEGEEKEFFKKMDKVRKDIEVRPTASNLKWGANRVYDKLKENKGKGVEILKKIALTEAELIVKEDIKANKAIGNHGLEIFKKWKPKNGKEFKVLTHCHAGSLATGGYGTALGVIKTAFREKIKLCVYADETRPLLQGARITAWELDKVGIPVILIPDNNAGWVMKNDGIDMIIVGADRIAANGDTANKVGTYSLSILAKEHKIPFYVAAPTSTIDWKTPCGGEIRIEKRSHKEVTRCWDSNVASFLDENEVLNYAFDVTPHENIDGIITEEGIIEHPDKLKINKLRNAKKTTI